MIPSRFKKLLELFPLTTEFGFTRNFPTRKGCVSEEATKPNREIWFKASPLSASSEFLNSTIAYWPEALDGGLPLGLIQELVIKFVW